MAGYWRREAETLAAIRDGWLHTGDMGWVDADGFLYLSGRRTNLVCLVGGEKFHPEPIEERLKLGPLIADCVVFGEGCKNAYALVVPAIEAIERLRPDEIASRAKEEIVRLLADSPGHWRPKDFALVPPFSTQDGLLTSTLKIRRMRVLAHHANVIAELCARNGDKPPCVSGR
jgi:long-chain acyl-CoA synthetase